MPENVWVWMGSHPRRNNIWNIFTGVYYFFKAKYVNFQIPPCLFLMFRQTVLTKKKTTKNKNSYRIYIYLFFFFFFLFRDVHLNPDVSKDDAVKSLRKRLERATKELKLLAEKKSLNVSSGKMTFLKTGSFSINWVTALY